MKQEDRNSNVDAAATADFTSTGRGSGLQQCMVRELAEKWVHTLAENSGATDNVWDAAKTVQLRQCCDELLAVIQKIPNDPSSAIAGTGGLSNGN